ncbi:PREDICTED: uncharacterized protein K02A2.6-like [Cyphomyrmex costatus]|uniref:uncharacterized protein K02A2.6-like n=1 Tax=Cyphomyrmex costatus TaxID=456900 RepID=UPI0008524207|nr:PREDICTED: uncharacterized protein K02A2.6-like [Cyphomyrmex costatus]
MQDRFSKWVELRPLRRATATAVTQALAEDVILRHGCPEIVISDNGTQFRSAQLERFLTSHAIRHTYTPAHTPQCNPVERTNRSIKTMIAQYVDRNHRNWDERIPEFRFAYNSAHHDATGYTPAYVNLGRELLSPANAANSRQGPAPPPDVTRRHLEEAYELVKINLAQAFQRQQKYYDLRRRAWKPKIGEKVYKKEYPLSKKSAAFNAKLAPKFKGPLEVRRVISPVIFDLRDRSGRWHRHVHISDLKPAPIDNDTDSDQPVPNNIEDDTDVSEHEESSDSNTDHEDENNNTDDDAR